MFGDLQQFPVSTSPVQICPAMQGESVTLFNQDLHNVVNISYRNTGSPSVPIQPLTSGVFDTSKALYASAPAGTAPIAILPGMGSNLSPSAFQIQQQLQPGLFTIGVSLQATTGLTTLFSSASAAYRIWGYGMSCAVACTSAFVTGATFFRFTLQNANMLSNPLIFAETVLSAEAAGQIANGGLDEDFDNPINMPATDSVQYAVNNGNSITGAFLRGSFWVKVSIP